MTQVIFAEREHVDWELLRRSHMGTSWSPEKRADGWVSDYLAVCADVQAEFEQWVTDENEAAMKADLELWRQRYVQLLHEWASSHSRVVSQMITGAGGWTARMVRSNNKRGDVADARMGRLFNHKAVGLEKLRRQYDPVRIARRPIRKEDADAIERYTEKIAKAERLQELMKAANKIVRSKKLTDDEKVEALMAELRIKEAVAREILAPDYMGRVGFAPYKLSNNNANIRRMKEQVAKIERLLATPETSEDYGDVTVEVAPPENRVRIFFPGKPDADVRKRLKASGFRWTPSLSCWQAYINQWTVDTAKEIANELAQDAA